MRSRGHRATEIARELKRHPSTIYREVERNCSSYDGAYRSMFAVEKTNARRSRYRRNRCYMAKQFAPIERMLREDLGPEQVVGRLQLDGVRGMSHETIERKSGLMHKSKLSRVGAQETLRRTAYILRN